MINVLFKGGPKDGDMFVLDHDHPRPLSVAVMPASKVYTWSEECDSPVELTYDEVVYQVYQTVREPSGHTYYIYTPGGERVEEMKYSVIENSYTPPNDSRPDKFTIEVACLTTGIIVKFDVERPSYDIVTRFRSSFYSTKQYTLTELEEIIESEPHSKWSVAEEELKDSRLLVAKMKAKFPKLLRDAATQLEEEVL